MIAEKITGIFNEKDPYDISAGTVHFTGEETGDIKSGQKLGDIIGKLNKAISGSILPIGGETGDFLRMGADGPEWDSVPFAEQSSF